jgi:GH15 family glucan-1,4-alpha-glucosidase
MARLAHSRRGRQPAPSADHVRRGRERWLPELIVDWLPGYEKSAPVRVGNAAYRQLQLDVFGEIADAMFQALKGGMEPSPRAPELRPVVLDYLANAWREPDEGIWEVRGGPQHFVHSKVMAWVRLRSRGQ